MIASRCVSFCLTTGLLVGMLGASVALVPAQAAWSQTPTSKVKFAAKQPPPAVEKQPYTGFSFCDPVPVHYALGACGPGTTQPSGGNPPYHFQLGTMGGFPPMGIKLLKDGQLTGTPQKGTGGRTFTFTVCAIDLGGNHACDTVRMRVLKRGSAQPAPAQPTLADLNGTYNAVYTVGWTFDDFAKEGDQAPFSFTINNGQISAGATGTVEWSGGVGQARISTNLYNGTCSGNWSFTPHADHTVTVAGLGLECRGPSTYNTGTAQVTKTG